MPNPDELLVNASPIGEAMDLAIAKHIAAQAPRTHLGMSQIGKNDNRTLWLQFRGCLPNEHEPRTERIFRLGDAIEIELARYISQIPGVALHRCDDEGRPFRFSLFGGHFAGTLDGCVIGLPGAEKTWHVWEAKSVSSKRFGELEKQGVKTWSPEYFAQLQCYMGASGMERALFTAYNKDDSRIYIERVRFEPMEWAALQTKALRIIEATEPTLSSYKDRSWYEAKWMPPITSAIHRRERLPPKVHCRNCRFSSPITVGAGAQWTCALAEELIPPEIVSIGCNWHQWIPALFPGELISLDDVQAEYQIADGRTIINGEPPNGYLSSELAEASKTGFSGLDAFTQSMRADFGARIEHVADSLVDDDIPF